MRKAFSITPEMKLQFTSLRAQGVSYKKIGKQLGVSATMVRYHTSDEFKQKMRARTILWVKKMKDDPIFREKRRTYMRGYIMNRYNNDPEFRKRMQEANRKGTKERRESHG